MQTILSTALATLTLCFLFGILVSFGFRTAVQISLTLFY